MKIRLAVVLLNLTLFSCVTNYTIVNKDFDGITGLELGPYDMWGHTIYRFGRDTYNVNIFGSRDTTLVEEGYYNLEKNKITFEPTMKRLNLDTTKLIGGIRPGAYHYLPKFYADSVTVNVRNSYFKTYLFTISKRQGVLIIYNPENQRDFGELLNQKQQTKSVLNKGE
jgi:hypothetical protein